MLYDPSSISDSLLNYGFCLSFTPLSNIADLLKSAHSLCSLSSYDRGKCFKLYGFNNWLSIDKHLLDLVYSPNISSIFNSFDAPPQDIFITHEYKDSKMTDNNFLHFDRLRSLKIMVYLEDVTDDSGPFTIVENSHLIGKKLRLKFKDHKNYHTIKNKIDLHYPEIDYKLRPILGKAGTTIFFDSDTFHMGGNIKPGFSRTVIRSHWYKDQNWRKL